MRECGPHGCQCGLAGVDAGHVPEEGPRLSLSAWIEHVIQGARELQDRGRRGQAVAEVTSACLAGVHDLHQHVSGCAHNSDARKKNENGAR